jgi:hypothetical protein
MGLIDRFTGSDGDDSDGSEGPDHYRIVHMSDGGGWQPVDGYDDLDDPIDEQTFRYNEEPLTPGKYRLFAVENNLNKQPPDGDGWATTVEDDDPDEPDRENSEIDELRREIRQLAQQQQGGDAEQDIQELMEKQKAAVSLQLLQSEEFLRHHGDKIALSMFDVDGVGGAAGGDDGLPDYDVFSESPTSAALYSIFNTAVSDPAEFEQLTETLGSGVGSMMGGAVDGMAGGSDGGLPAGSVDDSSRSEQPTATDDDQETTDDEPTPDIDVGPTDPDALLSGDDQAPDQDQLVETVAEAETAKQQAGDLDSADDSEAVGDDQAPASSGTVRREGPGTTSGAGTDPMSAGPTVDAEGDPGPDHATNGHSEDISDIETPADAREQLQSDGDDDDTAAGDDDGDDDDQPQTAAELAAAVKEGS